MTRRTCATLLLVLAPLSGCWQADPSSEVASQQQLLQGEKKANDKHYVKDREAFKAIFFGVSETKKLSAIWPEDTNKLRQTPEYSDVVASITDRIAEQNPKFFTSFDSAVSSGDPLLIDKAVQLGRLELVTAVDQLNLPDRVGQDFWHNQNILVNVDLAYNETRIIHRELEVFDEALQSDLAIEAIAVEFTKGL